MLLNVIARKIWRSIFGSPCITSKVVRSLWVLIAVVFSLPVWFHVRVKRQRMLPCGSWQPRVDTRWTEVQGATSRRSSLDYQQRSRTTSDQNNDVSLQQ